MKLTPLCQNIQKQGFPHTFALSVTIVLLTIACLQLRWENFVKWHVAEALEIETQPTEQFEKSLICFVFLCFISLNILQC